MKCIVILISALSLLATVAQAQRRSFGGDFGPGGGRGAFGPVGGRGAFGPVGGVGGVGGFMGRPGFGAIGGRGLVGPGIGLGGVGIGAVGVVPAVVPTVIAPVARILPAAVVATPVLGVGLGPRAIAVARTRVIVGRSVPEEFKFSYLPKFKQIELFFGQQRIACEVEFREIKLVESGVYNVKSFESSRVDLELTRRNDAKPVDISIYYDRSVERPGMLVKSKICYEHLFRVIRDEFKKTRFDLIVA